MSISMKARYSSVLVLHLAGCQMISGLDDLQVADGLIVWYTFEDSLADGVVDDASGAGHPAACDVGVTCPVVTAGRRGSAVLFDGASQYLTTNHAADLRTTSGFTIAAWISLSGVRTFDSIMALPIAASNDDSWQLELGDAAQLSFTTSGADFDRLGATTAPATGTWIHVAGTWDGTSKSLYVDGAPAAPRSPFSALAWDMEDIYVGADLNAGAIAEQFLGAIDDVRLYDRALSAEEIDILARP